MIECLHSGFQNSVCNVSSKDWLLLNAFVSVYKNEYSDDAKMQLQNFVIYFSSFGLYLNTAQEGKLWVMNQRLCERSFCYLANADISPHGRKLFHIPLARFISITWQCATNICMKITRYIRCCFCNMVTNVPYGESSKQKALGSECFHSTDFYNW